MARLTLEHIKGNTYYIPSPTNIGVFVDNDQAILIDSGNDKEAGRQILRLLGEQGLSLKLIVNTHSNADHIGGNAYLQDKTDCLIAATRMEAAFINDPMMEAAFLYGGFPNRDLHNKFLVAKPSLVTSVISSSAEILGTGLHAIPLPGHYFDMIGVKTPDGIFFIADSLFPEYVISKYHLFYLLDIRAHLDTLERLRNMEADLFIPSHGEKQEQVDALIEVNKGKIYEIMARIRGVCHAPVTMEEVLEHMCTLYDITLNPTQYVLVSSTIRSFLTYLYEEGQVDCFFERGKMMWREKKE
ncbi:MBL fold metallo-hydrolase [Candidatus Formimonas warabiya]|uniref:MBL fold metallo-hydrolase n=1 Tax=Formimonas warabiya TaxID=1761012 RepID=A0A3G1KRK8_FORW1|nr:MBL fold metallo-hydrolase [Candidatus Formimonas warabiya]ATW25070.1 MBL fold metallo-hydrolase [Candidatus Formimonas warabiya]